MAPNVPPRPEAPTEADVDRLLPTLGVWLKWDELDPTGDELRAWCDQHGKEFIERLKRDHIKDLLLHPRPSFEISVGPWTCEVSVSGGMPAPMVTAWFMSTAWREQVAKRQKEIFRPEAKLGCGSEWYSVDRSARALGIPPMREFKTVKEFDEAAVTDFLGKGLDPSIAELIKLLNEMGICTTSSCGGHEADPDEPHIGRRFPYIHVALADAERMLSLLRAWRVKGGLQYEMRHFADDGGFQLRPSFFAPLATAQEDIAALTAFLRQALHGKTDPHANVRSLRHSVVRLVGDCFGIIR